MTSKHAHAPDAHGVRPTDLAALVAFDEEVYENHAYARERLARPGEAPRPLSATIEQWLGRGRRTWIDVRGRQIEGIATARELGSRVWVIDTLIDASGAEGSPDSTPRDTSDHNPDSTPDSTADNDVFVALLRKARDAALEEQITHLLLRTHLDSGAHGAAMHCGFKQVRVEETWAGDLASAAPGSTGDPEGPEALEGGSDFSIRRAGDHDDFGRFQLFNHVLPLDAREALALTLEEWQRTRERRWLQRGGTEWVALSQDSVVGSLQLRTGDPAQLELLTETRECAAALLDHATSALRRRGASAVLAVAPAAVPAIGAELAARGLERQDEFAMLCQRLAHPVAATARVRSSLAVPTRG